MTFVYDELNRLTKQRNQLLEETQYFYFGDGLLKERKEPQSPLHRMTFSYNPQGSLQTVTDGENHVWTYAYYPNQTLQTVTDANQNTVTFTYYKDNLVKQVSQPEGQVTGYEYDANRHQSKLTDGLGQVIETGYDDEERVAQVDYRPSVQNPNPAGVRKLEYGYYPEGNVQQVRETFLPPQLGPTLERTYTMGYDVRERLTVERRRQDSLLVYERRYDYDRTDRLKEIRWNAQQTLAYGYDNVGNRKTELGVQADGAPVNVTYSYDGANRLKDIQTTNTNALVAQYEYNPNGNVTTWTSGTTSWTYTYDIRDQLTKATKQYLDTGIPKEAESRYDYDCEKRRIGRMNPAGEWTRMVYAGDQILTEHSQENALVNRYEYGLEIIRGEADGYYLTDEQGSVTAQVADFGAAAQFVSYDPWGQILAGAPNATKINYTGQWRDAESGLVAMGNGERYTTPPWDGFYRKTVLPECWACPLP